MNDDYDTDDDDSNDNGGDTDMMPQGQKDQDRLFVNKLLSARATGQRAFPLYLTKRQKGILQVPEEMTRKDYELLKQQIENHLAIILVTSIIDDEEPER